MRIGKLLLNLKYIWNSLCLDLDAIAELVLKSADSGPDLVVDLIIARGKTDPGNWGKKGP